MILRNRYNKIMENIQVTPEMEARILQNIAQVDLEGAGVTPAKRKKLLPFPKILSLAACLVVLIVGAFALRGVLISQPLVEPPPVQVVAPEQFESLEALCDATGFELLVPTGLPEGMQAEAFTLLGNGAAEIIYSDGNYTLTYRMAVGTDDISGDYMEYPVTDEVSIDGYDVTLKGDASGYTLAIWTDGGHTFALYSTRPLTQEEISAAIVSLQPCV